MRAEREHEGEARRSVRSVVHAVTAQSEAEIRFLLLIFQALLFFRTVRVFYM